MQYFSAICTSHEIQNKKHGGLFRQLLRSNEDSLQDFKMMLYKEKKKD